MNHANITEDDWSITVQTCFGFCYFDCPLL